jgi:DNA-binding XRE family transcriptional regulator
MVFYDADMHELTNLLTVGDLTDFRIDPEKLKTARGVISQTQAANACGVTRGQIHAIESGRSQPSAKLLARLCILYDKDVRDLLVESDAAAA